MAAAELTGIVSKLIRGLSVKIRTVVQVTQYDWVQFPVKGIQLISARLKTGAGATVTFNTLTVNNSGTAYTASSNSIAYDGGAIERSADSFYLKTASGEILEVIDSDPDAASGTLSVLQRAALGTTASATGIADNNTLYVLNTLVLGDNTTGPIDIVYSEMENDPAKDLFASAAESSHSIVG